MNYNQGPCNIQYHDYGCNGIVDYNNNIPLEIAADPAYQAIFNRFAQLNLSQYEVLTRSSKLNADNYNALLQVVRTFLTVALGYRLVLALPDGTVIIDSARPDDIAGATASVVANSFVNFTNGTINANHNTRVAVLNAQLQCQGYGYEKKYSTTTLQHEVYVAARLGIQFNNEGTLRLSFPQQI